MRGGAEAVALLLKSMAHPQRLLVLCALADGPTHVGALQERLGLGQAATSQVLARLRLQGLVAAEKHGQQVFYRLPDPRVAEVLALLARLYCKG